MRSPNIIVDQLIHAAFDTDEISSWALDDIVDRLDTETVPAVAALRQSQRQLAAELAKFDRYSDGRQIRTSITIEEPGFYYEHLWPVTATVDAEELLCSGPRQPSKPGDRNTGLFAVFGNAVRGTLRVELTDPLDLIAGDTQ